MGESAAGDVALVAAARSGVGPDVSLLVDAACVWPDARTALARAKAFERYDLFLLEEPLHPDDIDGYIWCASVVLSPRRASKLRNTSLSLSSCGAGLGCGIVHLSRSRLERMKVGDSSSRRGLSVERSITIRSTSV